MKIFLRGALLACVILGFPLAAAADVSVSVSFGPPVIPVYAQPPVPGPGYIWTPGYWAWDGAEYYWVPGVWVLAPVVGYLWTPPWWGWSDGFYVFHSGYWAPRVGFYGGIDYGYGYGGTGYLGGYWSRNTFFYNRAVNNITNTTVIHNIYNKTVINNVNVTRISYNGGPNGVRAQPNANERAVLREHHVKATTAQISHREQALRSHPRVAVPGNHAMPRSRTAAPAQRAQQFEPRHAMPAAPDQARRPEPNGAYRPTPAQRAQQFEPRYAPQTAPAPARRPEPDRAYRPAPAQRAQQFEPRYAPQTAPAPARRPEPDRAYRPAPAPARPHPQGAPHMQREEPPRGGAGRPPHEERR